MGDCPSVFLFEHRKRTQLQAKEEEQRCADYQRKDDGADHRLSDQIDAIGAQKDIVEEERHREATDCSKERRYRNLVPTAPPEFCCPAFHARHSRSGWLSI